MSKIKSFFYITILSLWMCALIVPAVVTIVNAGNNPIIVLNFNEEEQQESGKKDVSEEKIASEEDESSLLGLSQKKNIFIDNYIMGRSNHDPEIPLPPPERKV